MKQKRKEIGLTSNHFIFIKETSHGFLNFRKLSVQR